jgi:hypothetical protein
VVTIHKCLNAVQPIPFFQFIMNPDSFSQTVENLFYLAFLVKDGKVALEMDDETGEPMLSKAMETIDSQ